MMALSLVQIRQCMVNVLYMSFRPPIPNINISPITLHGPLPRNLVPALSIQNTRIVLAPPLPRNLKHLARGGGLTRRNALIVHQDDPRRGRLAGPQCSAHLPQKRQLLLLAAQMAEAPISPHDQIPGSFQLWQLVREPLAYAFDPLNRRHRLQRGLSVEPRHGTFQHRH